MRRRPSASLRFDTLEDRLTPSLAFDPSFGVVGRTFLTPGPVSLYGQASDAVVRPDGKIWVLGNIGSNPVLSRFNPNGELDRTFDGDGVEPILPWSDQVQQFSLTKMAVQADGRVVLAGTANSLQRNGAVSVNTSSFLFVRVNEGGTLDESFGDGGRTLVTVAGPNTYSTDTVLDVGVTADGRVTLAGSESTPFSPPVGDVIYPPRQPALVSIRLTPTGGLDAGYDGDGKAVIPPAAEDGNTPNPVSAAVLADGRVVFARARQTPYDAASTQRQLFLSAYRLAADGSPDATFNGSGSAETPVVSITVVPGGSSSLDSSPNVVGVQPDGQVLIATTVPTYDGVTANTRSLVARFTADGRLDSTFADNGLLVVRDSSDPQHAPGVAAFVVGADGRFLVDLATTRAEDGLTRFSHELVGYRANGSPDTAVGPNGVLPSLESATPGETLQPTVIVPDGGRLLIAGTTDYVSGVNSRIELVRFVDDPLGVPPTADNQNVVGAFISTTGGPSVNLDRTFANGGPAYLTTTLGPVIGFHAATTVDADGNYLVLGRLSGQVVLARFTPAGTLDPTFDDDGVRPFVLPANTSWQAEKLLVQPDGKIVVAGTQSVYSPAGGQTDSKVVVRRLNRDGSDDGSFGTAGQATYDPAVPLQPEYGFQLTRLADGRLQIVSADYSGSTNQPLPRLVVRRLTAAGQLDATYGTGGILVTSLNANKFTQVGGYASFLDGSVAVAGTPQTGGSSQAPINVSVIVLRLSADGTPDTAFGSGGYAETLLETVTPAGDSGSTVSTAPPLIALQPAGIVVGTGVTATDSTASPTARSRFHLVRFTAAGTPDAAFGENGRQTLDARSEPSRNSQSTRTSYLSLLALPDGGLSLLSTFGTYSNLIDDVPATSTAFGTISATVRRFTADGRADGRFGILGSLTVPLNPSNSYSFQPYDQAVDAAGRVVLGGSSVGLGLERLAVTTPLFSGKQPTVYVSGANGTIEGFQTSAIGTLVSVGVFTPFTEYAGVVRVATGDVNGDGLPDTLLSTGERGSKVRVLLGLDPNVAPTATIAPIDVDVFESSFDGGVGVATGDADGDGRAEFAVTPNVGGSGRVVVYSLVGGQLVVRANFFGIDDQAFRGGATAAFGDTDGDGKAELIVAAGFGGGPRVAVFRGVSLFSPAVGVQPPKLVNDFFAFPGMDAENLRNGVAVTAGDATGDGVADLVFGGGSGGAARVYALDGKAFSAGSTLPVANFFVGGNDATRDGVRLAFKDVDGDGKAELIANAGGSSSRAYNGTALVQANAVEPPTYDDFDSGAAATEMRVYVG